MAIQLDFTGKGVLVTDSASGIGRSIAAAFHELGASVAIHDPSPIRAGQAIGDLGGGTRLIAAPGDLAKTSDVAGIVHSAIRDLGRLDVLVCCSLQGGLRTVERISEEEFERVMGANTKKAFFTTQHCVPALRATRGAVVHVASTLGLVGGPPGAVGYATASGATVQMTRMMALELAAEGIRVNGVCLGCAHTDAPESANVYASYFKQRSPLGRTATPDECVGAVLYLAAPFSGYSVGATLVADGGIASGHYIS
jgi:NAD(P)-dependent dehydrogenase (short-subunit alcohol dehydrogenase family)